MPFQKSVADVNDVRLAKGDGDVAVGVRLARNASA